MPSTPNRQLNAETIEQANSLLQVLSQLTKPDHGLVIALPNGQVLAANTAGQTRCAPVADNAPAQDLPTLLGISARDYAALAERLCAQEQVDGSSTGALPAGSGSGQYTCRLMHYQQRAFICVEFTRPGQPAGLPPVAEQDSYHTIFENSLDPQFILDPEGHFIDFNQSALALIGRTRAAILGESIFRSFGLNLFERVALRGQLRQALAGRLQKFEWWLQGQNQELLPIEITLQAGRFKQQQVIFGYVKNLYEMIDAEQDVRFRNHQLEFINQLITKLSTSDSQLQVLDFTLDELLAKSDISGGCVYTTFFLENKARLSYTAGKMGATLLPAELDVSGQTMRRLFSSDKGQALAQLRSHFARQLQQSELRVVPVTTDKDVIAFILVWAEDQSKMPPSFLALLDFIGSAIGNYIAFHQLQQQLLHSEDKYRLLFESSYDAILLFKDRVVVECNEKALELFRCTREDLIGHMPHDFSPKYQPDGMLSAHKANHLMQEVITRGKPVTFEWKSRRKDGTRFDAELSVSRLLLDGEVYLQLFVRDITQRKQVQQARRREEILQESMEQFRNFLEKVDLIHYSLDTQGNIVYANNYFLRYVEYSREELLGRNFYDLLVPEPDREQRKIDFRKALETRQLTSFYERDVLTKSGLLKTIRWNCMFEYGPEGEITGMTSVGKDMTDKRIAMEALKDNKIRLQDVFDNAHDLIQNISVDNKFIFVNKAWKERLGYTDDDIESLTLNDIVHPYYKAKLIYQLRNLYKGENVNKIETVFLTKAGKPIHLIGSITCSWQDERPVATRAILHDITDRIKAERLQKVYYSIANLAISSKDLHSLYSAIHRELSKIIETRNIYIALCDREHTFLNFVYLVDQHLDKAVKTQIKRPFSFGLSEYIIETGKPMYMQKEELLALARQEGFKIHGAVPEVILCSPLAIGERIIGVITLQDYQNPEAYVSTDIEILHFISNQVALAIERKRNEEQINNQNARLNAIFESGTHHMWSLNRGYELTSFNRNFAASFERRIGQKLMPYTRLDDAPLLTVHENSFKFWDEKYQLAFEGKPQHFEVHLQNPESWREVYLNPIYREDGTFEEISGIALDITDKKASQLALAKSEEKFRHIFESFQDVYYRITLGGKFELVSPSVKQLLGYTEEEIVDHNVSLLYAYPEDREILVQRVLEQESIREFEVQMVCKDGTRKTVLLDARLVYDDQGDPMGLEGVARDVSELKRTQIALLKAKEEAENLLKVKTQFLANMSHELRTPMNGIIGMIDLLSQMNNDAEQSEYIDTLRKSSDALLAILNDILDLSKIQAGKLVMHESGVDLHETLDKIHSLFANRAQQKDLDFTYSISPGTPRYIITDETRLLQILSNLTSNAIKFTSAGKVSIKVSSTALSEDKYRLHVRVKDSGIGISAQDQQLLFTEFTQVDNSSTKTFGGTGLGLAISKQLTHMLGGNIGVESVPGDGSTFWFDIVVGSASEAAVKEQLQRQQQQLSELGTLDNCPYVLLVDDNQINQKVALKQLERLGCRTDVASNGYEAIAQATAHAYDIIFMDIQMPEMDGVTATRHIKEQLGKACPPIVAMTAYSMKDDGIKFMNQGLDDYVSKPVKSSDLHAIITKWENRERAAAVTQQQLLQQEQPQQAPVIQQDIIDRQVIEQLRSIGGEDFTKHVYTEFEQEAAQLLEEAKKELQAQQYKSILSTLHQLKGTGFTLGINQLAELAKQLEHDIKHDHFEAVEDNFNKLLEQYHNYCKAYKEIII